MTLLFYGLGNHEDKYLQTKHNIGRVFVEGLASLFDINFDKKDNYFLAKTKLLEHQILLAYPTGYMNTNGLPLITLINYFKLDVKNEFSLLIAHDDSDQLIGSQKLSLGGGSSGHKGVDSVYQHTASFGLNKNDICRLKIGIRPPGNRQKSETFVLSNMSGEEAKKAADLAKLCYHNLDVWLKKDISKLQTLINTKSG